MNEEERRELRVAWSRIVRAGWRIICIGRTGQSYIAFARDRSGRLLIATGYTLSAAVGQLGR